MRNGTQEGGVRQSPRRRFEGIAGLALAIAAAGCAGVPAPTPDAAPTELMPTMAGHPGTCYTVDLNGWTPGMAMQATELANFQAPAYVYLDMSQEHRNMGGHFNTGTQQLSWSGAREARWMSEKPYPNEPWALGHAHWWTINYATHHIGFTGDGEFWIGFEAVPNPEGMTGVFRYWSAQGPSEAGEPAFEVGAVLTTVDCRDTPMVLFE